MKKRSFFWYLFSSFLFITAFAVTVFLGYSSQEFKRFFTEQTVIQLKTRGVLFSHIVNDCSIDSAGKLEALVRRVGQQTGTRFTVVQTDGKVIADSKEDPALMENHANRPELKQAFDGDTGISMRYSATLSRDLMYVAIPVVKNSEVVAAIRTSIPIVSFSENVHQYFFKVLTAGAAILVLSMVISFLLSRRLSSSLILLKKIAETFAHGNLEPVPFLHVHTQETADLAHAMNTMAEQLADRIRTITRQKNEQIAILSAMVEGVVAVDCEEHIIMINNAAGTMLGINPASAKGKWVQETVRNTVFQKFIQQSLAERAPDQKEIQVESDIARVIEIQSTPLHSSTGNELSGVLIVMHDVTHLKKLETVRRDFVANVSHELRTPLTSIKGFLETLRDGAMKNPQELERFLTIVQNQVNRLYVLVEDLLALSRLEKEDVSEEIVLEKVPLLQVIQSAVSCCSDKAQKKSILCNVRVESALFARLNASLFEQAIINLIDNAINYSNDHTTVTISAEQNSENVIISVADQGCGISAEHIPRIFERFYRVDKARSKKLGGTGLGLSIVKHILQLHNGDVTVNSAIGQGTEFTIVLPCTLPDSH